MLAGDEIDWTLELIVLGELLLPSPPETRTKITWPRISKRKKVAFIVTAMEAFAGVKSLWHPVKRDLTHAYVRPMSSHSQHTPGIPTTASTLVRTAALALGARLHRGRDGCL
jgi:hypothetical protein